MTDNKFDPVKEFVSLRDSISKTVGESLKSVTKGKSIFPNVDVYETSEAIIAYTSPMLGANPSTFEVSVENNVLRITGETASPFEIPENSYLHRELQFGTFEREIPLGRNVKADEASASFKNGVLTVTLPKLKQVTGQIVEITPVE